MVHLVGLLIDLVVLVGFGGKQLLGALNVQQNARKSANGIGVAAHHHVGEAHIVRGGYLAGWNMGILGLFMHFDVLQHLDCLVVVA